MAGKYLSSHSVQHHGITTVALNCYNTISMHTKSLFVTTLKQFTNILMNMHMYIFILHSDPGIEVCSVRLGEH